MATHEVTTTTFESVITDNDIVLLDFWATWCPPCRAFGPVFEKASETHTDVYFGKIDTDQNQGLSASVNIQAVPTLMAFKKGKLVYNQAGALRASDLEDLISKVRAFEV